MEQIWHNHSAIKYASKILRVNFFNWSTENNWPIEVVCFVVIQMLWGARFIWWHVVFVPFGFHISYLFSYVRLTTAAKAGIFLDGDIFNFKLKRIFVFLVVNLVRFNSCAIMKLSDKFFSRNLIFDIKGTSTTMSFIICDYHLQNRGWHFHQTFVLNILLNTSY